jgi:hypothetical protein
VQSTSAKINGQAQSSKKTQPQQPIDSKSMMPVPRPVLMPGAVKLIFYTMLAEVVHFQQVAILKTA